MRVYTLLAQVILQIALTIAITINGLAILAKLSELEHRTTAVDINTIADIRNLLEKLFLNCGNTVF